MTSPIQAAGLTIQEAAAAQEFMEASEGFRIYVTDHALYRAVERFRQTWAADWIEDEVRAALRAGRVTTDRHALGLARYSNPASLYVWTPDGERIYALKVNDRDEGEWIVTTTMRKGMQG